jgi:predicted acyltransferase (DUF342 family)
MRLVTLAIVVAAVLFGVEAAAVQEQQLPYSGVALTPSGAPVADGLHQMEFRLYTGATASEPVWTELQLVQTRSGSYQVVLGQSRPLPLTTGQQYWLEVLCDGASLGRMPLALLPSQAETKVAARSLQELHLNPVQSAAPDGWMRAGLPTLGGATPPQPLVVNTCEECTTTFWALTGNAGTNPNNNFLGTTDDQPLIIRTNNVNRVRITTGGQIEVLNSARSVSLGEGAGISQDLTESRNNVFVGFQAGSATETGIRNVAVGSGALSQNIDGSSNTALGSNAMSTLTTGDYNTAIGYGAEVGDGLTNATAIGAFAFAGQSNTVVIGSIQGVNGATATANVGIGTTTPMNRLHVVSTADPLRLEGLLVNSALDNVLVVDASGVVKKRSLSDFVGSTAWLLTGNTLSGGEVLGSLNPQPLVLVTSNVERMRITAAGDVGIGTNAPAARLDVVNPTGGGVLRLQAVVGQTGALLEWVDDLGNTQGVIDNSGLVGIGTAEPVQKLHVVGNGSVSAVFVEGGVGVGTVNPLATLHVYDEGTAPGATRVIIQAGENQSVAKVNLLEWWDNEETVLGGIDYEGNLFVNTNTTLGDAATDVVTVKAGTVSLPNIPGGSTATDVLVRTGAGNVQHRSASGLISDFAWMLGGNTLTDEQALGTLSAHDLPIITAGTERVRITQAGDVGIGTSTPEARLHVVGTGRFDGQLTVTAGGAAITGNSTVTGTLTVSSNVSVGGNLAVTGNATVSGTTVSLPNIPGGSAATDVLVRTGAGNVEHRSASGLISDFAWMLGGNTLTDEQALGTLSAHDLPIITAGTERVRITQAGDVGIGTSTPEARLHVVGTGRFDGQLTVTAGGAAITGNSTVTGTLTVSSNVSVGGNLAVTGNATVSGTTVSLPNIPGGSAATDVLVRTGAGNVEHRSASGLISDFAWMLGGNTLTDEQALGTLSAHDLPIITAGTERVRITQAGDVGIGTSTPEARLHVVGTGRFDGQLTVTAGGAAITGNSTVTGTLTVSSNVSVGGNLAVTGNATVSGTTVSLPNIPGGSAATDVLVRTGAGNVEHRSASGLISDFAWMLGGNTLTDEQTLGTLSAHDLPIITAGTERVRITQAGDVGIGTSTPEARLHVVGTGRFEGQLTVTAGGAAITGNSTVTGTLTVSSNVSVGGNLAVTGNATVSGTTVSLPNIPGGSAATDVLVRTGTGNVEHRSASGLIGDFAWMLGGNTLTDEQTLGTLSAHDLPIITAGTERVRITQAGDVGIGTSTPEARLHVVGTGRFDGQLTVTAGGAAITGNSTVTGTLTVSSNVSVGGNLAVTGNATVSGTTVSLPNIPGGSAATDVLVRTGAGNVEHRSASGLISDFAWMLGGNTLTDEQALGTLSAHDLPIITAGTERVRITQAGDVGIGTSTPEARLHVVGTGRFDGQLTVTAGGAAITGNSTVTGTLTVSSNVSVGGNLAVTGNATVSGTTVSLPNIPGGSAATDVLVRTGAGNVEHRSASGLISDFAWMLTGNSITLAWNGTSGNFLGTTNEQPLVIATTNTASPQPIQFWTNNVERMRITATGEVVVQNQAAGTTVLRVLGGNGGAGATQVVLQAGTGQSEVNLLEWRDGTGELIGVIDDAGFMGIGVNNAGFGGIAAYLHVYSNTAQPAAVFENGIVRIGNIGGSGVSAGPDLQVWDEPGATQVILQLGTAQTGVNLLEWQDAVGTVLGGIDDAGNLFVNTSTTLGDAATDVVTVKAGTVALLNIPGGSAATDVLVRTGTGNVEHRSASGLIGDFAWMLGGNTLTDEQTLGTLSAHDLPIITAGTERVRITQAGDVGIGTSTPEARLHVVGTGRFEGQLTVTAGGAAITGNSTVTGTLTVSSNVSVGGNLAVTGNATVSGTTVSLPNIPGGSAATDVLVRTGTGNVEHRSASGLISDFAWMLGGNTLTDEQALGTLSAHDLPIITAGTERVRITQAGDVGIGTSTPEARLHVVGTGRFDGQLTVTAGGAAITGNSTVTGTLTVSSNVSVGGNLAVTGNATVSGTTVSLPNIPGGSTATDVLVRTGAGNVEHRSASGLISDFAWMLTGNSITLAWNGTSGNFLGTTNEQPLVIATTNTASPQPIQFWTNNVERMRITATGEVVVQNQAAGTTVLRVLGGGGGAGATQVVLQAGTGQSEVNLLEWRDGTGELIGVIDDAGFMGIGVNNAGFGGIAAYLHVYSNTAQPAAVFENGIVRIGNIGGSGVSAGPDLQVWDEPGATQVILQLGTAQTGVNLLEWQDAVGTVLGGIDAAGNLFVNTSTTLGDAATDVVTVKAGTVALLNIPGGSTATDVLVRTGTGNVEHRSASGLIGDFAWMLGGNTLTDEQTLGTLSAHDLPIITAGTERVRITQAGDVGIGTSTPEARLHVVGTGRFEGQLTVTAGGAAITGNSTVTGTLTVSSNVSVGGNLAVTGNATVSGTTVSLPNIPGGSTATDVLVRTGTGNVEHRSASGLISDFAWMLGGNNLTLLGEQKLGTQSNHDLPIITNNVERMRITATGEVVVQNQAAGTTVLRVLGGGGGAGATQVVLQAGTGQSEVNLLEWRDGTGELIGVIDDAGFMGIGVNNAGFGGIAAYLHVYSNLAQPAAIFENGAVGIGTNAPEFGSTLHIYDARTGATKVIIQAGANQAGVNLLEWQDDTGLPVGFIDNSGNVAIGDVNNDAFPGAGAYLHIFSNTAQPAAIFQRGVVGIGTGAPEIGGPVLHVVGENPGAAARFEAGAGSTPLELQGVPTAAATDEVLRIDPATGEVKRSTVAALISAGIIKGSFSIETSGSSFTISVPGVLPGAIVTVTLVGPSGGTIYPLMVTNVAAGSIKVESSATIPGGAGYAIHYIIVNL